MFAEILPVSLEDKQEVIDYIRHSLNPSLVNKNYSAEQVLLILHRMGTWRAKPAMAETQAVIDGFSVFFAGVNPVPRDRLMLEQILAELNIKGSERFTPYGNYLKGGYRILGCFTPNSVMAKHAPETEEYFTAAIPLSTQDYQSLESPIYYPPILNIHKLMAEVCDKFDARFELVESKSDIAKVVADFYFGGLVMVHPFLGGNHRAFDRFIEYAFLKKGFNVRVPLNETLNIPNDDPFNKALYSARKTFLQMYRLTDREFTLGQWKDIGSYLEYQHQLGDILASCLSDDCVNTEQVAQALLTWR